MRRYRYVVHKEYVTLMNASRAQPCLSVMYWALPAEIELKCALRRDFELPLLSARD